MTTDRRRSSINSNKGEENTLDWDFINQSPSPAAYHCACVIDNAIYIHGGVFSKGDKNPLNKLQSFDTRTSRWTDLTTAQSPYLSHHSSVVLRDRYFLLIGGWDGKVRTSDVHSYDTVEKVWKKVPTSGFPEGAGLSSHTSTLLSNDDILILGREGGLRMQRRTGNAYILTGNLNAFKYRVNPMGLSSRSGHTAVIINNNIVVHGGRDDKAIEEHGGYKKGYKPCSCLKAFVNTEKLSQTKNIPIRRHHSAIEGCGMMLVFGGEPFSGRSIVEPSGDIFLITFKPNLTCYKLASSSIARSGQVLIYTDNDIYIHGGLIPRGGVSSGLFKLKKN
ncbi:DgyrCDS3659 [Dimorphilus gyrociliatus]|uniref:DgyrCDS3659 n=1 Tax=Dimorphilus gyrociliatus TaxID=2664684 RepID=A0A7I8VFS5_9ANNE|nr:DgyrCDS3659 [Dimorphilus gyrociliatus]